MKVENLYTYFLYGGPKAIKVFKDIYNEPDALQWVKTYGVFGKQFYIRFMEEYSKEIRETISLMGTIIG